VENPCRMGEWLQTGPEIPWPAARSTAAAISEALSPSRPDSIPVQARQRGPRSTGTASAMLAARRSIRSSLLEHPHLPAASAGTATSTRPRQRSAVQVPAGVMRP
jgi:hypothetical protein